LRSASLSSWTVCRFRGAGSADLKLVATNLRTLTEQLLDEGAALPIKGFQGACRNILGSRSDRGDLFAPNLKSVIHTCRKQRRHVLTYLNSAIHAALRGRKTPSLIATT